jgi:hypothetical protein
MIIEMICMRILCLELVVGHMKEVALCSNIIGWHCSRFNCMC